MMQGPRGIESWLSRHDPKLYLTKSIVNKYLHLNQRPPLPFANVEHTRFGIACAAVGAIQSCLDACVKYARERHQFKKPIGSFQLIQEKIAEMVVDLESSRWLAYRLAYLKDKNVSVTKETSIAKYHNMEALARCAKAGVEIHGSYGLSDEFPVERLYRDCMAPIIYGGTANVHKLVLGRLELGIDAVSR